MSPHQAVALMVRLFAIWLAIFIARSAPSFVREASRTNDSMVTAAIFGTTILAVLVIIVLWFFPKTIARGLLDSTASSTPTPSTPDTWFAVGCALIGLWLFAPALASLIYNLWGMFIAQRDGAADTSELKAYMLYYVVEIALGIWLILGAKGARRLFWWARSVE